MFEAWLETASSTTPESPVHFVGQRLTMADFAVAFITTEVEQFIAPNDSIVSRFPLLSRFHKQMTTIPSLASYLAKRPNTPF